MKKIKVISAVVALSTLLLSGCGIISNRTISDDAMIQKAASALGLMPRNITVFNRSGDMNAVHFFVKSTLNDKMYQCAYHPSLLSSSDAICHIIQSNPIEQ